MNASKKLFQLKFDARNIGAALLPLCLFMFSCTTKQNYDLPDEPRFEGSYAEKPAEFDGTFKVVTWNIKLSQEIEAALAELDEAEELKEADILLLQEMNEDGVETIARALKYDYIYFPASINTRHDTNIGNAILSKWPISEPKKLLLPFENPADKEKRIAIRALVTIGSHEVLVYSVHTETYWLGQKKRLAQFEAITKDIDDSNRYAIVGGDFNTTLGYNVAGLEKHFRQAGFEQASADSGPTFQLEWLKLSLDHIFAKGLTTRTAETLAETKASDHLPVSVTFTFEQETALDSEVAN